jgi:hypothetical protein
MMEIYDYGSLTPIYSQVAQVTGINTVNFLTEETDPTVPAWVKAITQSNIANWDDSYGNKVTSAAVTGTNTKTLTLNQQDGGTVTASWTDINTDAVSSVFGRTGAVIAQSGDYTTTQVTEGLNLYYTDGRVRNAISESIVGIDYNSTTGVFSTTAGYSIPTTSSQSNWDTAYANRITSLTTTGSSGAATLISNVLNIPNYGSVLGNYVPYTGATGDVNLGVYTLSANSLNVNGVSGAAGYLGLKQSLSVLYGGGGYTSLNGEDKVYLTMYFSQDSIGTNYKLARFNVSALTNNTQRTYNLPNASGTLALTSDITNLTFSAPLVNTAGVISIPAATNSVNGYLTSTDWATFNNKQAAGNYVTLDTYQTITASKTFSVGFSIASAGGTNQPTFFENTNNLHSGSVGSNIFGFNTANNIFFGKGSDNGGVLSWNNSEVRYYTLPNANGTLALTSQLTSGTVTSVAASITGNAIGITGSPITSSGTLAFAFTGNATQYVRGDGALATLPTGGGGGGASVSYYLNGSINQGTIGGVTYYEMNKTPIIGAGTDFTRSSNGYIASFLTDANDPALLNIPAGNFNFETYFQASSGGGSPTFYIELYKYDGTTFTLIASNSATPKLINDGTNIEAYFSALAVPQTTLTLTDRLAIRIYVTTAGRTITMHTENGHLCQVITTFTTGLTALNGLTAQVQYLATGTSGTDFNISSATATHTFNLPTASATNTGKLSSTDWSTFNAKQATISLTTTGTSGAATLVGATLNIPQYQGVLTNPITGTGTSGQVAYFNGTSSLTSSATFAFTPTSQLLVNNSVTAASAIARGTHITPTLTASANNDVLVALDISATFNTAPYTGVNTLRFRASNFTIDNNGRAYLGDLAGAFPILDAGFAVTARSGSPTPAIVVRSNAAGNGTSNPMQVWQNTSATNLVSVLNNGNLLLNTTTDAGFRLDVNGTARVQGNTTITDGTNTISISPSSSGSGIVMNQARPGLLLNRSGTNFCQIYDFSNDGTFIALKGLGNFGGTGVKLFANNDSAKDITLFNSGNVNIGGNLTDQNAKFYIGGSVTASSLLARGQALNTTLVAAANNDVLVGLDINPTFTNGAFTGVTNAALRTTTGNVLLATTSGNIGIGTSSPETYQTESKVLTILGVTSSQISFVGNRATDDILGALAFWNGTTRVSDINTIRDGANGNGAIRFRTSSSGSIAEAMRITNTRNVLINTTTDAGFRLDVNGTARVQDLVHLSNASGGQIRMWTSTANNSGIYGISSSATGIYGNAHIQFDLFVRSTGSGIKKFGQSSLGNTNNICITNNNTSLEPIMITTTDSGAVGIMKSNSTIPLSAALEIESTTKGFLPPRMTTAQKNAIGTPATGLVIYDTTLNKLCVFTGVNWETVTSV